MSVGACSGADAPPPPPPPPPTTTAVTPPPSTAPTPPTTEGTTPPATTEAPAPVATHTPHRIACTSAGACAIHEGHVSCWGQSARADVDEERAARPEIQLTGEHVDLQATEDVACAKPAVGALQCFGDALVIADAVRLHAEDDGDDYDDDDDEGSIRVANELLADATDAALGPSGVCLVTPHGQSTIVRCAGDVFEPSALDGIRGSEGIVEVCIGDDFACGRTSEGGVRCWGDNTTGQLGDGTDDERAESATSVRAIDHVTHLGCGSGHACALRDDGTVWCWGANDASQLAQPASAEEARTPRRIEGIEHAQALVVGPQSSCALGAEGPPRCWGANRAGQLGDGTTLARSSPVEATAVGPVRDLSIGPEHACAVRGDDASEEVVCWGLGVGGALGPRVRRRHFEPVQLFRGASVSQLSLGVASICARIGEGPSAELRCAGAVGTDGTSGTEATSVERTITADVIASDPSLVSDAPRGSVVTAGSWRCDLSPTSHTVSCAQPSAPSAPPVTLSDVTELRGSYRRLCALGSDGGLRCAALDATTSALSFVPLPHLPPARAIAATAPQLCVVTREAGEVVCEGVVRSFEPGLEPYPPPAAEAATTTGTSTGTTTGTPPSTSTGTPTSTSTGTPPSTTTATTPSLVRYRGVRDVVAFSDTGVVRLSDGRILRIATSTATPTALLDHTDSMIDGLGFACARRVGERGAEVYCWGRSPSGQLAQAETSNVAVRIPGLEVPLPDVVEGQPPIDLATHGVVELVVGSVNVCARLSDGRVMCWGDDVNGQLGRLPETLRLRPVVVLD